MTFYELTFILDDKHQKQLEKLTKRYKKFNDWTEKDLLQFAVTSLNSNIEILFEFLELKIEQLERNHFS